MNPRILKKLSKRAEPYVRQLMCEHESLTTLNVEWTVDYSAGMDLAHLRTEPHPEIPQFVNYLYIPKKNTVGIEYAIKTYEQHRYAGEWHVCSTYEWLREWVFNNANKRLIINAYGCPDTAPLAHIDTPSDVFKIVDQLIVQREQSNG